MIGRNINVVVKVQCIIATIPLTSIEEFIGMPIELIESVRALKYTSVNITYISQNLQTTAHWLYCPDLNLPYHRILVRGNFCEGARGYWTETNSDRYLDEGNISYFNEYAYPLNTIGKPKIMKRLLRWSREKSVF